MASRSIFIVMVVVAKYYQLQNKNEQEEERGKEANDLRECTYVGAHSAIRGEHLLGECAL